MESIIWQFWAAPPETSHQPGAQAGEASRDAVLREVKEETGLDASEAEGGYLFTYKRENPGEGDNYFVDVYRFVMDVEDKDLKLQTEETDGYMFATLEQIRAFAAEGKFLHYDSIKKVFEFWADFWLVFREDLKINVVFCGFIFLKTLFFDLFSKNCLDIKIGK